MDSKMSCADWKNFDPRFETVKMWVYDSKDTTQHKYINLEFWWKFCTKFGKYF
jgi:hypothetical protein